MARDPRDYKLELSDSPPAEERSSEESSSAGGTNGRPFLSVYFACCATYTRIYRNAQGDAYQGRCPRCGKAVHFRVGTAGTDARFFVVH